jgi:hypothetical protein
MTSTAAGRAAGFMTSGPRILERRRFDLLFADGPAAPVRAALLAYANPDGGFGHALEPDLRGPGSQPLPAQHALEILLDELGTPDDPLVGATCDWLEAHSSPEGGVPFVLAGAFEHPHAPWFAAGEQTDAGLNPAAAIAALLHAHGVEHPWRERATAFCWDAIERLESSSAYELRAILPFLQHAPDRDRAARALERIAPFIAEQVTLDPAAGGRDKHRPWDFAPDPGSPARALFDDATFDANLDALAAAQQDDGGWTFDWLVWTPATELEWRGIMTIRNLGILRAYGRA